MSPNEEEEEPNPDSATAGETQAEAEPEQGFIRELSQFFVIPSLIVLLCVGIFIMFGMIASEKKDAGAFLQEIREGHGSKRWMAAFELSRLIDQQPELLRDKALERDIIEALRNTSHAEPAVRMYLITALERLGHRSAAPAIIACLADADPNVRLQAAKAIGSFQGVSEAVKPLSGLLDEDDPSMRKVAIYALGQTRDPAAIPLLKPRLEDHQEDVRWNTALALATLGDDAGLGVIAKMLDRDHLDTIEVISQDQKIAARINGLQAVYLLRDESLMPVVRELSRRDPSLRVREIALRALEAMDR